MFRTAVLQRFGDNGMRQMLRAAGQAGVVNTPSVMPQQQKALNQVAALAATLRQGERAAVRVAQRHAESERQGQRSGMRR
jgi:hypothetical protein